MTRKRLLVTLAAIVAFGLSPLPSLAQTNKTDKTATPVPTPSTAGMPLDNADSKRPASQNWLKVCGPTKAGKACVLRQVVSANGQFLGSFLLHDDPGQKSQLMAIAAVPLGVLLPYGLTWQIDGNRPMRVPYLLCDKLSCVSEIAINQDYLNALKKGSTLNLIAKNQRTKDLVVPINLAGFTQVYDGSASLTYDQLRNKTTGNGALEQVLQDRAEQLRQKMDSNGNAAAATTPAPAPAPSK